MKLSYMIDQNDVFFNVKEVLKVKFQISDRLLLKLKRQEKILLNSKVTSVNSAVHPNDIIEVILDFEEDNSNIMATKMYLDVIYEDEAYLIINKPSGFPIHPSMDHFEDSISNGVKYYLDTINLHKKIRPVNRLDRNTSGIVIFAKNEYIHDMLSKQMKNKQFKKEYIAICEGVFDKKNEN